MQDVKTKDPELVSRAEALEAMAARLEALPEDLPVVAAMPALVELAGELFQMWKPGTQSAFRMFYANDSKGKAISYIWWSMKCRERGFVNIANTTMLGLRKATVPGEAMRSVPEYEGVFYEVSEENVYIARTLCGRLLERVTALEG